MLLVGMGMFLACTPVDVVLFERMIAVFKVKANAGFFVYICGTWAVLDYCFIKSFL
jgi:hypothetical protein